MPTISFRFPAGRYHATPWGHHVNEGLVEWPPCPWRLLRALIATGYTKLGWTDVPPTGRKLIESLARVLPTYQLPAASAAHSRHYMPIGELSKGIEKTTLVFDTWANIGDDELVVRWACDMDEEAVDLLAQLVERISYLGRSESWVEARFTSDDVELDATRLVIPQKNGEYLGPDWEQIPLLAPVVPDVYASWRGEKTQAALADLPLPDGKRKPTKALLKKRAAAIAPFPDDLIDCLQKDTVWWKKQHRWSRPPGARQVLYWRKADSLTVSRPATRRRAKARPVEAMLLALSTPSRNKSALPHVHRTLPQGELFHRAVVGRVGKGRRIDCPELTGRDADGRPLRGGHRHAHVMPLDLDGDRHIDHILIWAPMGLGDAAQTAIRTLKRTWTKGGTGDLQLAVVGRGDLDSLRRLPEPLKCGIARLLGGGEPESHAARPIGSRVWISRTPFVPPRFVKPRGKNTLAGQVQAELRSRGLPEAIEIEVLPKPSAAMRHFVRVRGHGGNPPPRDAGYAVRLVFDRPVSGPIALGYACHYGLGLFEAHET